MEFGRARAAKAIAMVQQLFVEFGVKSTRQKRGYTHYLRTRVGRMYIAMDIYPDTSVFGLFCRFGHTDSHRINAGKLVHLIGDKHVIQVDAKLRNLTEFEKLIRESFVKLLTDDKGKLNIHWPEPKAPLSP